MKDKYLYRHQILEYLYQKVKDEPIEEIDLNKTETVFNKMAADLKIEPKLLRKYHHGLHAMGKDKDHVSCKPKNGNISLTEFGLMAYVDDYWLKEGEKEINERIYDKTKWTVPVFALFVTIVSLTISTYKVVKMTERLNKMQQEIDTLRQGQKSANVSNEPSFRFHD